MRRTRRELVDDLVQFMGEKGDDEARQLADRILNRALTGIWLRHPFKDYRSPVPYELTLTVNQIRYALPDHFGRVGPGPVRNLSRQGTIVYPCPPGDLAVMAPQTGTSDETAGYPEWYEIAGVCGVHTQPASTGEALEAVSDNAGDIDIVVAIAGDDANGRWTRTQVTLTGLSAVALGTWSFVDECAKAYQVTATPVTELTSSRGTVTIRNAADRAERQKLFPQESALEHPVVGFAPKPSAGDVLAIPMIRKIKRLLRDADAVPDLWEPAVWEAMTIEWGVQVGAIPRAQAASIARPALFDLICYDNESTRGGGSYTTPYGLR